MDMIYRNDYNYQRFRLLVQYLRSAIDYRVALLQMVTHGDVS